MSATAAPAAARRASDRPRRTPSVRRPALLAAAVFLVLSAVMVGPGLLPGRDLSSADIWWSTPPWAADPPSGFTRPASPDLEDAAQQFQPLAEEVRRQLPGAPLWNPWIAGGRPLLATAQTAVFSPFSLPTWVLPVQESLAWSALLKLWAACFGMWGLARALGMRFAGALMAGLVYGLSLWQVSHLSYAHAGVWALLPWVLWATDRLVRRPGAEPVALLAGAVGLTILAGHPESSFHVLLAAIAFFALRVGLARRDGDGGLRLRPALVAMGAGLTAGVGLAAVLVVPFAELLLHSADFAERSGTAVGDHVDPAFLLAWFLPDYWGRATSTALAPFLFARSWYVGALPLMLAAAALVLRPRGLRLWIAGAGAFVLAVVFGLPPFVQVVTRLPLISSGHNDRLVVLAIACLALLAGWGLDELTRREAARRRAVVVAAAVVLALPLVMVLVRGDIDSLAPRHALEVALAIGTPPPFADPAADDVIRLASVVLWVGLAGAGLLLLVLRARGLAPVAFAALALGLVAADLLRAGMGYNPAVPDERTRQPATPALELLAERTPARFAALGSVPQNVISLRGRLQDARGYDVPIVERYNRLWRREVSPEVPDLTTTFRSLFLQVPAVDERRLRTLRLLGVTDLLAPPAAAGPPAEELRAPGLRPVYDGPDARVLRVDGALPRTFVAGAQRTVEGEDAALDAVTDPALDPRRVVVSERRLPGVPEAEGRAAPAGSARIVSYAPDRVVVDARLARRGVVVLGDTWFPGWEARVDGREVAVERVDYVLRGAVAGPGRHRVEFRYAPTSWRIGWITSVLTLAALAVAVVVARRRGLYSRGPS